MPPGKFRCALLGAGAVILLGMAVFFLPSGPRLTEDSVRDTSGITIQADAAVVSDSRITIPCRIQNHTHREAASIVFTAEATTEDGRVLAANPLGNVLDLKPGEARSIQIALPPVADLPAPVLSGARVDLVRWKD